MSSPTPTLIESNPAEIRYPAALRPASGPILVATDGTKAAESAFLAAAVIAQKINVPVRVLMVVEPLPIVIPEQSTLLQPLVASPELLQIVRQRMTAELTEIAPKELSWTAEVGYGRPSAEIVDKARECAARMIVIGLVHHGITDRLLDGETAIEMLRQAHAPVLLTSADWTHLPKKAVFAVDFSTSSMRAAQRALELLDDDATIILTHICPIATVFDGMGMWEDEYENAAGRELARFEKALSPPAGMKVERVTIRGHASSALIRLSETSGADLIVSGTRGTGLLKRLFVGSVASRLVHHASCSLLIVPDQEE